MNLLLDTNILVHILRSRDTDAVINFITPDGANLYISVVSEAEIRSLAIRNKWGETRCELLEDFLDKVNIVEITQLYVNTYAQIDSYSQRLNSDFTEYSFPSPRNMGKNDLWIASLAGLLGLELVTTDADFDHLHNVFCNVRKISPAEFKIFS